jgi:hypothetical protein
VSVVFNQPDDRSLLARAYGLASQVTAIAAEMVAPILIGAWFDRRLGYKGLFAIIGGAIGVTTGIWSLLRMAAPPRNSRRQTPDQDRKLREPPA